MRIENFIYLASCFFAQSVLTDGSGPAPSSVAKIITVTEIRRVMPDSIDEGVNARQDITQIRVSGLEDITGKCNFIIQMEDETQTTRYQTEMDLQGKDEECVVFDGPLVDSNRQLLVVTSGSSPVGIWDGNFTIQDLKARVAIVADDYVRLTPGNLLSVTDGTITCENEDNNPCYFRKEDLAVFPPAVERCIILHDEENVNLTYCDDSISEFIQIPEAEAPKLLLRDRQHLHLYDINQNHTSIEVLAINPLNNSLLSSNADFTCKSTAGDENSCDVEVDIPENMRDVIFTVVFLDQDGYVDSSDSYPFKMTDLLTVTEIRRVMSDDIDEGVTTRGNFTQVRVKGLEGISGTINFELQLENGNHSRNYQADIDLKGEDEEDVTFDGPLGDSDRQLLVIGGIPPLGIWEGQFDIQDLKARVAIVADDYVRVTPGDLLSVTDGNITCGNEDNSPCYFRKEELAVFPPFVERCIILHDEDDVLTHCDDTITEFVKIPDAKAPQMLLMDSHQLYLYDVNQTSIEVVAVNPFNNNLLSSNVSFTCESTPGDEHSCSVEVDIPEDMRDVNFTVVFLNENGYVNASDSYLFETFKVHLDYQTGGAVYVIWTTEDSSEFRIIVTEGMQSKEIKFDMSVTCGPNDDGFPVSCYAYFIRLQTGDVVSVWKSGQNSAVAVSVVIPDSIC